MGDIGSINPLSLLTSTIGVYLLLQIQIYDIVLQSGWWFGPLINKAYSLLQEVRINCFKSEYTLVFYQMDGWHCVNKALKLLKEVRINCFKSNSRPTHDSSLTDLRLTPFNIVCIIYIRVELLSQWPGTKRECLASTKPYSRTVGRLQDHYGNRTSQ